MDKLLLLQILKAFQSIEGILTDAISAAAGAASVFGDVYKAKREGRRKRNGSHTREQWETLKASYNFTCLCCYRQEPEIKLTRDHVIPLADGGNNGIGNLQPLCEECNSSKGPMYIDYRGFYRALLSIQRRDPQTESNDFLGTLLELHHCAQAGRK